TNIIVSAYLGGSLEAIIVAWKSGRFTLIVSAAIMGEYLEVLQRPKFNIERAEIEDFSALLLDKAEFVIPLEQINAILADPSDNKFLNAAVAGYANLIVSGDGHLLELKTFRDIRVISGREFLESLK
ncbi:MAG TPA: putative toxin-antitoxin system toxin component, PIN family, partial [Anaerolineales bacterium]|nr:putative toxin-antitoxin system toxin component, PIN family [Anaerolineales bacterium]